ncbi:MAG: carboxymuconolactone decarboxylase family protein [Chlamydiia bacterium]|nr:carboxymuconolactone decarboxylase family protein [Chlamydiia bacterium]
MSRLPDPTSSLQGDDLALYEKLCRQRGAINGMYRTLLNHPQLTKHISDLGTYLRFESTLEAPLREFIILFSAHRLNVRYEWISHLQPACKAQLKQEIITKIQSNAPLPEPYHTLALGVDYALKLKNIAPTLQDQLIKHISIKGLLELVTLAGFYRMIAGIITSFDVPPPQ